jgi:hypothetical protein
MYHPNHQCSQLDFVSRDISTGPVLPRLLIKSLGDCHGSVPGKERSIIVQLHYSNIQDTCLSTGHAHVLALNLALLLAAGVVDEVLVIPGAGFRLLLSVLGAHGVAGRALGSKDGDPRTRVSCGAVCGATDVNLGKGREGCARRGKQTRADGAPVWVERRVWMDQVSEAATLLCPL